MTERKPATVTAAELPVKSGSSYPAPYDEPCRGRHRQVLGDVFGLDDFGVNHMTLDPGAWSSQRHWHTHEDEFVFVLSGHPTLVTDAGETLLGPGMCAGFPAGEANGHHLVNNTDEPVVYLEMGSRKADDDGHYADIDMQILQRSKGGKFTRKDGTPYP
jgi:uncharacterized cupin superfamily protein